MNSNWSFSPETLNSGQIRRFFVPCDLEIWRMTLKNNRAPLLCYFRLCASFHSYGPETTKLCFDLCGLDLWPLTLTFCMDITSVIGKISWWYDEGNMVKNVCQTDGQTEPFRAAWSRLNIALHRRDFERFLFQTCVAPGITDLIYQLSCYLGLISYGSLK